jgi:hypothetical protein
VTNNCPELGGKLWQRTNEILFASGFLSQQRSAKWKQKLNEELEELEMNWSNLISYEAVREMIPSCKLS